MNETRGTRRRRRRPQGQGGPGPREARVSGIASAPATSTVPGYRRGPTSICVAERGPSQRGGGRGGRAGPGPPRPPVRGTRLLRPPQPGPVSRPAPSRFLVPQHPPAPPPPPPPTPPPPPRPFLRDAPPPHL